MIIAEIGLNHLGQEALLYKYLNDLVATDVDAITVQVREPEYYKKKPKFKLRDEVYIRANEIVQDSGKQFGVALCDIDYIDFFDAALGVQFFKVIRNDITNLELINCLVDTKRLVFVSTGVSSQEDIDGFIRHVGMNNNFRLNHTQLSYEVEDCNLSAIREMKFRYGLDVSFGSHCSNTNVLYASVAFKPSDILFYVKLDKGSYPDDKHAVTMDQVQDVVCNLKALKKAIGSGIKAKMQNQLRE